MLRSVSLAFANLAWYWLLLIKPLSLSALSTLMYDAIRVPKNSLSFVVIVRL